MIDLLPSIITLVVVGFFIVMLKRAPIVQLFIVIIAAYVVLFPALDFYLAPFPPKNVFAYHQTIFAVMFVFPLIAFAARRLRRDALHAQPPVTTTAELNRLVPPFLLLNLILFMATAYIYNLYLVRLGYGDFRETTGSTPTILLFQYRMTVDTSFFIVLYLIYCLKLAPPASGVVFPYRVALYSYAAVFGLFFLFNSRMQFLLLIIVIGLSTYKRGLGNSRRLVLIGVSVVALAVTLTLLRELVIEHTDRLDASSTAVLLRDTTWIIAARLNSITMLDAAGETYSIFSTNFSGMDFFIKFTASPFLDPAYYEYMKSIEETSPSVFVINNILSTREVDFPKSMIIDVVLIFGAFGLVPLAYILSTTVVWIQRQINTRNVTYAGFVLALYVLPLVFQFEKEFLGFITSLFKWSPLVIMAIIVRPRQRAVTPIATAGENV
jgi:hypothetical protein